MSYASAFSYGLPVQASAPGTKYATVLTVALALWLTPLAHLTGLATVEPVSEVLTVPLWPYCSQ